MKYISLWGMAITAVLSTAAIAQEVSEICKSVPTIFKDTTIKSKSNYKTAYKRILCSASWETYQDVVNAGMDITVPIYEVPTPISANYSQDKQRQWQNANCSEEEKKATFDAEGFLLAKEISPRTASAWLECIRATQANAIPRALACKITETESAAIFEAKWRMVEGMKDSDTPIVRSLDIMNTKCPSTNSIKKGTKIGTGGVAILCSGNTDKAPMFVLNTDRGPCAASGMLASTVTELRGQLELKSPMIYKGDSIKLASDLKIITNGFNLFIDAKRLVIDGTPQIVSFTSDQPVRDRRGDSGGEVKIRATKLEGSLLTIQNFGQNGGRGSDGAKGDTGPKGSPGARRHWKNIEGCTGGHAGGDGGQGAQGRMGSTGATGGNGGDVVLDISQGMMDRNTQRISVLTKRTDRANSPVECGGTCPGLGGLGGEGGEGGDGGPGGDGAGGDAPCGGHPGGNLGPGGPRGPQGPEGKPGNPGHITIL